MNKEDLLILVLFLFLLLAALLTFFLRGERSRHGYGASLLPGKSLFIPGEQNLQPELQSVFES